MEKIQDGGTNFNAFAFFHIPQETFASKKVFSQKFCTPQEFCIHLQIFCFDSKFPQETLHLLAKMLSHKSFALPRFVHSLAKMCVLSQKL